MACAGLRLRRIARRSAFAVASLLVAVFAHAASFGDGGVARPRIYIPGGDTRPAAVLRQSDGKLVIAGSAAGPIGTTMFAARFTAAGVLDDTYGVHGIAYVDVPIDATSLTTWGAVLDSQDNLVIAGKLDFGSGASTAAIARLTVDGAPDPAFGPDGLREIAFPGYYFGGYATRVAIDSLGRIVLAGQVRDSSGYGGMLVARMTTSGSLDSSFNGTGQRILKPSFYAQGATALALDSSDNIVIGGIGDLSSATPVVIIKLTSSGQFDPTFSADGIAYLPRGDHLAIDPGGRVVIAATSIINGQSALMVARLTASGVPDASFAQGGWVQFDAGGALSNFVGDDIAIDHGGRIVVSAAAYTTFIFGSTLVAARFLDDGTQDLSFNGTGFQTLQPSWVPNDRGSSIVLDPSDNIILTGPYYALSPPSDATDAVIARITPTGILDPTFNGSGLVIQNGGVREVVGRAVARQTDGRIVIGGFAGTFSGVGAKFVVVRLTAAGAPDPTFNGTGFVVVDVTPLGAGALALSIDSNGGVVLAGQDRGWNFAIVKVTSSGQLMSSFYGSGQTIFGFALNGGWGATVIAIDASGNVLIGGQQQWAADQGGFQVVRLTPAGALDTSFGVGGIARIPLSVAWGNNQPAGIAFDSAGRVGVAGWAQDNQGSSNWAIARLTPQGAVDGAFGGTGTVILPRPVDSYLAQPTALAIDASDRLIVTGSENGFAVKRVTSAGQLDPSFGGTGTLAYRDLATWPRPQAIALDTTGRIVLAGDANSPYTSSAPRMMGVRILGNGMLDPSFDGGQAATFDASSAGSGSHGNALTLDPSGGVYLVGTAGRSMVVVKLFDGSATMLAITSVDAGGNPIANIPFDVLVESRDDDGNPQPVSAATTVALSLSQGTGVLGGALSCVIPAGVSGCRFSGVTYSPVDYSTFSLAASSVGGDSLSPGASQFLYDIPVSSTTTLSADVNPSMVGQAVTFTATVTAAKPGGSVFFQDGYTNIPGCSAVPLVNGGSTAIAKCVTSSLSAGSHQIQAWYGGDAGTYSSASAILVETVGSGPSANVASASAGAHALASSTFSALYPISAINNGDRAGLNFGNGGVWKDATQGAFPDWVEIDFNGSQTIDRVIVYSVQDNRLSPVEPGDTLTFTKQGITAFDVQTWNGSSWVTVASIAGNNLVKRTVSFSATTTTKIRILIDGAKGGSYSLLAEVEAWTPGAPPPPNPVTLASSANPGPRAANIVFTSTVTGNNPTGTVAFKSNGSTISGCGSVGLTGFGNSKTAACTTSFGSAGTYSIVANYSGDGANPAGASAPLQEVISRH